MYQYLLAFFLVLSALLYSWLTWHFNFWKNRNVPYVRPVPLFGSVKDLILMKRTTAYVFDDFYKAYPNEPAVGFFRLRTPSLLLRDVELIKSILIKEFENFKETGFQLTPDIDPIFGLNPFTAESSRWKSLRGLHSRSLTIAKLKLMVPFMNTANADMVEFVNQNLDKTLEAHFFCGQFTTDVVSSCVFGLQTNSFKAPDGKFRHMAKEMFIPDFTFNFALLAAFSEPWVLKLFKIRFIKKRLAEYFIEVVRQTCEYRKKNNIDRNDFLNHLLKIQEQEGMNYEEITAHCMTFFIDGYETASVTMAYILYALAVHQEEQEKLRKVLKNVDMASDNVDYDKLHSIPYLEWVINEAMRLYPTVGMLSRKCTNDTVLHAGGKELHLQKGVLVSVPIMSLHKDPSLFPEPDKFLPERFKEDPNPQGYYPFGFGPRVCLGQKFALTQMKAFLFCLLSHYRVRLADGATGRVEYDPFSSVLNIPKGGIMIKLNKI